MGGEHGAVVEYHIESNLDVKCDALSLWFNPVNWPPGEIYSQMLFWFGEAVSSACSPMRRADCYSG